MTTCNCKEMSCKEGCTRNHTHKRFSCEKCEVSTKPKWMKELREITDNVEFLHAVPVSVPKNTQEKLESLISKVESDTIERCVGEIRSCYEYESSMAGTKFKAHSGSSGTFNSGIDTAITKLKEMK